MVKHVWNEAVCMLRFVDFIKNLVGDVMKLFWVKLRIKKLSKVFSVD